MKTVLLIVFLYLGGVAMAQQDQGSQDPNQQTPTGYPMGSAPQDGSSGNPNQQTPTGYPTGSAPQPCTGYNCPPS